MSVPPPWLFRAVTRLADMLVKLRRRIIPRHFAALELGTMSWVSQSVAAFCELRLPEALADGGRTAEELAARGYGERRALFRLLRALAAYDVTRYDGKGRFSLGHLGKALAGENSVAPMIRYANASWHTAAYTRLADAIRENTPGFDLHEGKPMFAYFTEHREAGALFDSAMQSLTPLFAQAFARAYDFRGVQHVIDIGGGTGLLLKASLARYPHLQGTVFELPAVAARVHAGERLGAVHGSILSDMPPQADAYIFSHVLHDWDDDSCVRMLQNVRRAMPPHARVLIYEIVAPPANNRWSQDRITDLEMLAMLPGRERTRAEFAALVERAGLRLKRVIATGAPESILEVFPA